MDLFGLYGIFLISFGFLCIFFGIFGIVKIDFGSFIKFFFHFWVSLSFCKIFPRFFGNLQKICHLFIEIIAFYPNFLFFLTH